MNIDNTFTTIQLVNVYSIISVFVLVLYIKIIIKYKTLTYKSSGSGQNFYTTPTERADFLLDFCKRAQQFVLYEQFLHSYILRYMVLQEDLKTKRNIKKNVNHIYKTIIKFTSILYKVKYSNSCTEIIR